MTQGQEAKSGERGGGAQVRPRLYVVGDVDASALATLGARFDIAHVDAAQAAEAVRRGERAGVLVGPSGVSAIGRELVVGQEGALLEAVGEAACLCEAGGALVWANKSFNELDPLTRERVLEACRRVGERMAEGSRTPGAATQRLHVASTIGRMYEAVVAALPGAGGGDGEWAVGAVVRDVTAAHRTQQKIDALDLAGAELVRLEAESVRQMHVHDRLEFLRKKIVQLAHDLLQFDHFVIYLLEKDTNKLEMVMSSGLRQGVQDIQLFASREGNGISGYVAATGRSYICADAAKDRRYIRGMDTPGSSLTVPLTLNDKVIGVFNVESNRVGAFSEDDRHFTELFARHVAMALHMLNLLVAERIVTNETITGRMEGELQEPLNDLAIEAEWLREQGLSADPGYRAHVDRILRDVEAIRRRVKGVAKGAKSILGVEDELATSQEDPLLSGRRILVADDEKDIRDLIADVLRRRGAEVVVCEDGAKAIEALEAEYARIAPAGLPSTGRPGDAGFRLVISDIRMPDRNGYEVFSAVRRLDPGLPVVLMTGFGYDPHHSIVRASQEGLQAVLFKPFQVEKLLEEVHKAMGGG